MYEDSVVVFFGTVIPEPFPRMKQELIGRDYFGFGGFSTARRDDDATRLFGVPVR